MREEFITRIKTVLSFGNPVSIRDIGTLTFSSENDVLQAIAILRERGCNVWTDGFAAMIRGQPDGT